MHKAKAARRAILDLIYKGQTSHIGSNFSCVDFVTVLFNKIKAEDEVVFSAGWKAATAYYFLAQRGILDWNEVMKVFPNPPYLGLLEPGIPGVRFAGGSMGIAFSMAVGAARARKALGKEGIIYVIMSDGEMDCGNVWESAMKASHEKLTNLVVIVDRNGFQAMGEKNKILNDAPLANRWDTFGWQTWDVQGHDFESIEYHLEQIFIPVQGKELCKPNVLIATTTKGKGISFMENDNSWHYRKIDKESYDLATEELR